MKVFVVFTSDYDSYDDVAYFTNKEKANIFKKLYRMVPIGYRERTIQIKEVEVDVPQSKWIQYYVRMTKEGNVIDVHPMMLQKEGLVCFDFEDNLLWCINTNDKLDNCNSINVAIKAVDIIRLKILKNGEWGNQKLRKDVMNE